MKKPSLFGKYLLLERLNVGGMAEVFVAKAFGVEGFERILAIKKILPTMAEDEEFITMFIDEARISVQLSHANIVHIHELGKHDDAYYIAMEYVSGKDLRAILERFRRRREIMPTAMAVFVATKICEGLEYAHRKKDARGQELQIIHRDVSPQNILISYEGEVKIIDFGIAKAANRSQKTQAGILKGKFGYMSPEQVRGLPIDRRSDIFAVGVILYEMLTGEKLFVGESDFSTLEKVRNADVASPRQFNPDIPAGLEKVVLKALAREADDRYQWGSDLQEDLMRFLLAGDAIYSAKHLSAFVKDAFAEDLLKENEKLERFASVERPESVESSGITTSARTGARPKATTGVPIPRPSISSRPSSPPVLVPAGGAVASGGPAKATINIPPPSAEELAEMDGSHDRTMIVSDGIAGLGNDLKTAIGLSPFAEKEKEKPAASSPSGQRPRPPNGPAAGGSPTSETHEGLERTATRGPLVADKTMVPGRMDTSTHGLTPIEATGFRPALEHAAGDNDTNPRAEDPAAANETILPNRNRPKIVIGGDPISGATSIGMSPFATREFEESVEPTTGETEQPADEEERSAEEQRFFDEEAPDEPEEAAVRKPPRKSKKAAAVDGRRRGLLMAIGATGVLALVVLGAAVVKFTSSPSRSGIVFVASPKLRFSVTVNPGKRVFNESAKQVELEPGEYSLDVRPNDDSYQSFKSSVTVKEGRLDPVALSFKKKAQEPPPPPPVDPKPEPAADALPSMAEPKLSGVEGGTKPAELTSWSVTFATEPGVEISINGKRVGVTPDVSVKDLAFGRSYAGQAHKAGYEVLNFTLENPTKRASLEQPLTLVREKVVRVEPRPEPRPEPRAEPKVVAREPRVEPKVEPKQEPKLEPKQEPKVEPPKGKGVGKLACNSNPVGAEVFIDGKPTGKKTPVSKQNAIELPLGKHKLVFKLDGKSSPPQDFELTEENSPLVLKGTI